MEKNCKVMLILLNLILLVGVFNNVEARKSRKRSRQHSCSTPKRTPGTCIYLEQCADLYNLVKSQSISENQILFLRQSQCGRSYGRILVCCESGNNAPPQPQSRPQSRPQSQGRPQSQPQPQSNRRPPPQQAAASNLLPQPGVCGKGAANRIFGGKETDIGEYPWAALIEFTKGGTQKGFHCGGSLINNRYVLTAAHCIKGAGIPSDWGVTGVRLGEYDTNSAKDCKKDLNGYEDCSDSPIDIPIELLIVHKGYEPESREQYNDIALLRLSRPVEFTEYISPVCLPAPNLRSANFDGSTFDVVGWGKTETSSKSNIKLKAAVKAISLDECNEVYTQNRITLKDSQICAGGQKGVDSCSGDSGGPLIGLDASNKKNINYFLAGVVSFGTTTCGLEGWPGVYTKVGSYVDWIQRNMTP